MTVDPSLISVGLGIIIAEVERAGGPSAARVKEGTGHEKPGDREDREEVHPIVNPLRHRDQFDVRPV